MERLSLQTACKSTFALPASLLDTGMPRTKHSSVPVLPGLHPDGLQTGVRAQPWRGYRGSKATVTPSLKERAAEDMGIAINNFLFGCKLCSPHADGQKFALGRRPETYGCSRLPLTEPGGRGELD